MPLSVNKSGIRVDINRSITSLLQDGDSNLNKKIRMKLKSEKKKIIRIEMKS